MLQTPSIGKLCMLIVLCVITSYSQSKASLYLCDHARFRKPSRKLPTAWCILNSYACVSLIVHPPPLESLDPPLVIYSNVYEQDKQVFMRYNILQTYMWQYSHTKHLLQMCMKCAWVVTSFMLSHVIPNMIDSVIVLVNTILPITLSNLYHLFLVKWTISPIITGGLITKAGFLYVTDTLNCIEYT